MEPPCAEALFAQGRCTLPGWTTEFLLPMNGAHEQQMGIQVQMRQILENQQQLWEVQRYLQNYVMQLVEEQ